MQNTLFAALDLSKLLVPGLIIAVFLGIFFIVWTIIKRYKRIPPNAIGIIYGKKNKVVDDTGKVTESGFRIISGGGAFVIPIVEQYAEMNTDVFQIEISEEDIPTLQNVGVHVAGVATCRVSQVPQEQINAVQNFLGKPITEMKNIIGQILRGHLRSIVGGLEVEQLLRERGSFNDRVVSECSVELSRMGIKMLTLVIQDVRDKEGYIDALGKSAVAVAKRDAQIATAEAERETRVKTSDAARTAAEATAKNDALIKEAEKARDIQVADFKKQTATAQAEADMAGQIAKTAQEQRLAVLEAQRDAAQAEAQTKVEEKQVARRQQELEATLIVNAEAEAKALSIKAEGERKAHSINAETRKTVAALDSETATLTAEGKRSAAVKEGQGQAERTRLAAEAEADATRKTLTAKADGDKANLLAIAEGQGARLRAEAEGEGAKLNAGAEGKRRMLLAEAEGTEKLAEALAKLSEQGKLILVLDRLPGLLDHGGDAGQKIAEAIFGSLGKSLEKIGSITITDLGGGNGAKNGLATVGGVIPQMVTDLVASMSARGFDVSGLLKLANINPTGLAEMVSPSTAIRPAELDTTVDGKSGN